MARASRWLQRLSLTFVALVALAWATDGWWAIPLIEAAPNVEGAQPTVAPPDARVVRVTSQGQRIEAWVLSADDPRATVLVLHGIRDQKRSMVPLGRELTSQGFRAVLVDLRGHGASTGAHLSYGVHDRHDLSALLDELQRQGLLISPIGVHGVSYGAAAAMLFGAHDARVDAVVAVAPFASLREVIPAYTELMFGSVAAVLPDLWIQDVIDRAGERGDFDPDAACPRCVAGLLRSPLFLAHGGADRRVAPWHGERIMEARDGLPTERVVAVGANHGTVGAIVSARAQAFLRRELLR